MPFIQPLLGKGVVFNPLCFPQSPMANTKSQVLWRIVVQPHEARSGDVDQRPFGVSLDGQRGEQQRFQSSYKSSALSQDRFGDFRKMSLN
jgi:hypothetical protein